MTPGSDIQKRAQRFVIAMQIAGAPVFLLISGNYLVTYLSLLGLDGSQVLDVLALLALLRTLIQPPLAYAGDRIGRKKICYTGLGLQVPALLIFALLPFFPEAFRSSLLYIAIGIYGLGNGLGNANFFGILTPLIDPEARGRFLSRLRISWQTVSLLLLMLVAYLLDKRPEMRTYQIIFFCCVGLASIRIFFFSRIPEVDPLSPSAGSFFKMAAGVFHDPRLRSFCSYAFLMTAATAPVAFVNALLMQDAGLSKGQIVLVGNLAGAGGILGFFIGGRMVDRYGTKRVFISAHLGYGLVFALTPLHALGSWPVIIHFSGISLLLGFITAYSGIAFTSTAMGLADRGRSRSLTTSLSSACQQLGPPISLFVVSRALKLGVFSESWTLSGKELSAYDTLNFFAAVTVVLLLITLGQVPYNLRKSQSTARIDRNA